MIVREMTKPTKFRKCDFEILKSGKYRCKVHNQTAMHLTKHYSK